MPLFNYIKNNLSIVDVIAEYVRLKQAGNYWKGPCPFHTEQEASFTVSPEKQIFYCFGCHASGDSIAFIAKIENISQREAAQHLIERYKITIPDDLLKKVGFSKKSTSEKDAYYKTCQAIALWTYKQLNISSPSMEYLKQRGLTQESIKQFMIGYFPGGPTRINMLIKELSRDGILLKDLQDSGILVENKAYFYSSFEERIIFPIKDPFGNFCGFGGRIFKPGDERAKYYNSKESEGFNKGKILFGFDKAKKSLQEQEYGFLVEGYLDCIMMVQYGYHNTVATLGTACTLDHLKLLARHIKILYVLYDGDQAGQKATLRLAELCWQANLELKVIQLPPKEDPASLLTQGQSLEPFITQARDIFSFFIQTQAQDFPQKSFAEKIIQAEKITGLIAKVPDQFKQDLLLQQAASIMQLPFQSLQNLLLKQKQRFSLASNGNKNTEPAEDQPMAKPPQPESPAEITLLEEKIFSVILNHNEKVSFNHELLPYFSPHIQVLLKTYFSLTDTHADPSLKWRAFLDTLNAEDNAWVIKTCIKYADAVTVDSFEQLVAHFYKVHWKNIVKNIKDEIQKARAENNTNRLNELFGTFLKLKQVIQNRGLI